MPKLMKFSLRSFSTLFSWHKHCEGMMPVQAAEMSPSAESVAKKLSVDTELPVMDRENQHHPSSYTSLRDLMPTSWPISPIKHKRESLKTGEREQEEEDFHWPGGTRPPIKNHLVELAARAYLLPASTQHAPSNQFFARYWAKLTSSGSLRGYCRNDELYAAASVHSSGHLDGCSDCSSSSFSCLPSCLWLDFTRIFRCLFRNVRPQPVGFLRA